MDLDLKGRVVIVTGAARGLGYAYARALANQGAHVVVHDGGVDKDGCHADPSCANEAAEEIKRSGGSAFPVTTVLSDAQSCSELVSKTIAKFGRLDGLVHNAGLVLWTDTAAAGGELFGRSTSVNNHAAFWLCRAGLPAMRTAGFGRIVLTTSGWALVASEGSGELALYSHGKGAQFGLAMALAKGAGHPGILTNVIAPVANTRIFAAEVPDDTLSPEAVAGAVTWLASPACSLNGMVVAARDGRLALQRMETLSSRQLGAAARDPAAAGAALTEMSDEISQKR